MSQGPDHRDELSDDEFDALSQILRSTDVWQNPDPALEEVVVASVFEEARQIPRMPSAPGREDRRYLWIIAAAAALLLITGVSIGLLATAGDGGRQVVAMVGTDLAPTARATAELKETPQGLRVKLAISGLPPAEVGTYYQGWVSSGTDGVSIGTFHLRGGDGEVELWAGVLPDRYPIIAVTLQQEGEGPQSSGQVVLRGRLGE